MSPLVHAGMGDCYRSLKKFAEAIQEYTKGIKKSNLHDKIINQLTLKRSIAYTDSGKLDEALVDLQSVLHTEPNNVKAHL
jgi:tetratricopeptide (TPR) repeat protein